MVCVGGSYGKHRDQPGMKEAQEFCTEELPFTVTASDALATHSGAQWRSQGTRRSTTTPRGQVVRNADADVRADGNIADGATASCRWVSCDHVRNFGLREPGERTFSSEASQGVAESCVWATDERGGKSLG